MLPANDEVGNAIVPCCCARECQTGPYRSTAASLLELAQARTVSWNPFSGTFDPTPSACRWRFALCDKASFSGGLAANQVLFACLLAPCLPQSLTGCLRS